MQLVLFEHTQYLLAYAPKALFMKDACVETCISNLQCAGDACLFNLQQLALARLRRKADQLKLVLPHHQSPDSKWARWQKYDMQASHLEGYPWGSTGQNGSNVWHHDPDYFTNDQSTSSIMFHEWLQIDITATMGPASVPDPLGHQQLQPRTVDASQGRQQQDTRHAASIYQQHGEQPTVQTKNAKPVFSKIQKAQEPRRRDKNAKHSRRPEMSDLQRWKETCAHLRKCNTVDEVMDGLYTSMRKSGAMQSAENTYYDRKLQAEAVAELLWFAFSTHNKMDGSTLADWPRKYALK